MSGEFTFGGKLRLLADWFDEHAAKLEAENKALREIAGEMEAVLWHTNDDLDVVCACCGVVAKDPEELSVDEHCDDCPVTRLARIDKEQG